jgi:hypothetical protein
MPAVQPCCQQVSAVQRCKVLPARTRSSGGPDGRPRAEPGQNCLGELRIVPSQRGCLRSPVYRVRGKHVRSSYTSTAQAARHANSGVPEHSAGGGGRILPGSRETPGVRHGDPPIPMGIRQSPWGLAESPFGGIGESAHANLEGFRTPKSTYFSKSYISTSKRAHGRRLIPLYSSAHDLSSRIMRHDLASETLKL